MNGKIKESFDQINAEEELKKRTSTFVIQRMHAYEKRKNIRFRYMIPAAVCFLFVFIGGSWVYYTPTLAVTLDINPSIELEINRFDKVISVSGYNDDGEKLMKKIDVKNMDCFEAVEEILENEAIAELLSDGAVVEIGVIGSGDQQSSRVFSEMETCMEKQNNAHCYYAHSSDLESAHDMGLSLGKYKVYQEIRSLDPSISEEDIDGMTMRELRDLVQKLNNSSKAEDTQEEVIDESGHNVYGGHENGEQGNAYRRHQKKNEEE